MDRTQTSEAAAAPRRVWELERLTLDLVLAQVAVRGRAAVRALAEPVQEQGLELAGALAQAQGSEPGPVAADLEAAPADLGLAPVGLEVVAQAAQALVVA